MSIPRPRIKFPSDDQGLVVDVDWGSLPDGWQAMNHRNRAAGETQAEHATRVRALVAAGLIGAENSSFADHLEEAAGASTFPLL